MNPWVILPSFALVAGVLTSVYFFIEWIHHNHRRTTHSRFLLLWAMGLFLMYWFQMPVILAEAGHQVSLENFNLFFSLTFPITLAALFLYFAGTLESVGFRPARKHHVGLFTFLGASVLFFGYFFIAYKGVIQTYALPIGGLLLFYVPMYFMIIVALLKRMVRLDPRRTPSFVAGGSGVILATLLGLVRVGITLKNVITYPPAFWYIAMNSSKLFFVLQAISTLLYAFGFFVLYRSHRLADKLSPETPGSAL